MASLAITPIDATSTVRPSRQYDQFAQYLCNTKMDRDSHIPCPRVLITVQSTDSLSSAFFRLSRENISSAPVLSGLTYMGFLSVFDIVCYVSRLFFGTTSADWTDFFNNSKEFQRSVVSDVMAQTTWRIKQTAEPVFEDNSLMHALESLALSGAHRMAIMNNRWERRVVGLYTQSMCISEIRQNLGMFDGIKNKLVRDMVPPMQVVQTIKETEYAINAFHRMSSSNISALAIVDIEGSLIGTISTRDLRGVGLSGENFHRLYLTVSQFKDITRREFPRLGPKDHYPTGLVPLRSRYVLPTDTFETVITRMRDGNIHRVWVCSEVNGKPVPTSVLTQGDVLKELLKYYTFPSTTI
jgi:CBS domain-containing protein